jgi:rod shape-determining protein MreC
MRNFFLFLWRQYFFFLFLFLEIIAFTLLVQNNYYQHSGFINTTNRFTGNILTFMDDARQYFSLRETNRILSEENAKLLSESKKFYMKTDSKIFYCKDTLYRQEYQFISAKVIYNSTNKRNNYLTLNKGSNHGIKKGMGVITGTGILGYVDEVSPSFSSVISVLHKNTKVVAKMKKNQQIGTVVWKGGNYRFGDLIDIPTHVKPTLGDTVVTSGFSHMFPEGILIGTVADYKVEKGDNFYTMTLRFTTDYNCVTYAYVVQNLMKDEIEQLQKKYTND